MNKLQLLITDIDGTLLNTQKQISKQTLDYLIHLQQNNVVIALCSGRIPAELQSLVNQLQLDKYGGYIIHTNGAGIINCKTLDSVNFSPLHLNEMQELTDLAKKNNLYTIVEYNDSYVVECSTFVQFKRILTKFFWPECGVAEARGVILLAAAQCGVPIYEYTPMQVKQAITGYGKAVKKQIQEMTRMMLHLESIPKPDDTADALGMAIAHCHCSRSRLMGTPVR